MKLIYCPKCKDVFSLISKRRDCSCGASCGWIDHTGVDAVYCKHAILLGIDKSKLETALQDWYGSSLSVELPAYIFPAAIRMGLAHSPRKKK